MAAARRNLIFRNPRDQEHAGTGKRHRDGQKTMDDIPISQLVAGLGALVGIWLGFTARALRFCTLSAVETAYFGENWVQIRMWVFAIAVAAAGTLVLVETDTIDISETVHLLPRFAILGPVLGGLLFGLGMAAVGTCSFGAILRASGGDLRGLIVVLVVGIVGYMTIRGFLAPLRIAFVEPAAIPLGGGLNATAGSLVGSIAKEISAAPTIAAIVAILGLAAWCLKDGEFRGNARAVIGATSVGLAVIAGWYVTGYVGADDFDPQPTESVTFVAASSSSLIFLMTYTGSSISFPIGLFFGVLIGGAIAAWRNNEMRLEAFDDPREMRRHIIGAVLMGIGGVLAMGCSLGQGLTGVSTLALPSFLALLSMWAGAVIGLRILIYGWPRIAKD